MTTSRFVTSKARDNGKDERANCRPGKAAHGRDEATHQEGQIVSCRDAMLYTKEMSIYREIRGQARRTQTALVRYVSMLLLNPGFSPLGVTRLYMHSRSHTFVLMFHELMSTLKFSGTSIFHMSTFAALFQVVAPDGP